MKHAFWSRVNREAEGETGGAPVSETPPAPVSEAGADSAPAEEQVQGEAASNEAPAEPQSPHKGFVERIGQLTRQKRELEERLAAIAAQQQQYATPAQGEAPQITPELVDAEIQRRASAMVRQQEWASKTEKVWNDGLSKHPDWGPQLNQMAALLGGIPPTLTEAAIESGDPVSVLYHLAKNPDEAARVAYMQGAAQGVAIAKIASKLKAGPVVSNAPAPITPKVGRAGSVPASLDDPKLSMDEWYRLRQEEIKAKRGRR